MTSKEKKTLEDYIKEKIKKSGYPLEIEISDLLDKKRYVVFNTQYYFDEETEQGRDIDIYAMPLECHPDEDKLYPFNVRTEIAIECKKSETHAWVFYTRPRIPMSSIYISGQYHTSIPEPTKFSERSFQWLMSQNILRLHHDNFKQIAIAYDEIKKRKMDKEIKKKEEGGNGSSRREIFEATNQLVKFTCYEIHQIFRRVKRITTSHMEHIIIFFPTIVYDGDMFEVKFISGEPFIERKNHILLTTHHRCPYCRKVEDFTIDIVHGSYFNEYLNVLQRCFYDLRESILQKHGELKEKAKETRTEYETELKERSR